MSVGRAEESLRTRILRTYRFKIASIIKKPNRSWISDSLLKEGTVKVAGLVANYVEENNISEEDVINATVVKTSREMALEFWRRKNGRERDF